MKVTIESKFDTGDKVKCFHDYHTVVKVTYLNEDGQFHYLLECENGERIWQLEEDVKSVDEKYSRD